WSPLTSVGGTGATGTTGATGAVGATGDTGPLGLFVNGTWTDSVTYSTFSLVTFNGSIYISTADANTNQTPGVSSNWTLYTQGLFGGVPGPTGATGATGAAYPFFGLWDSVTTFQAGAFVIATTGATPPNSLWIATVTNTNEPPNATNSSSP